MKKKKEDVWRDNYWNNLTILIFLIFFIPSLIVLIIVFRPNASVGTGIIEITLARIMIFGLFLLSLIILLIVLKRKSIYLTLKGIMIGNVKFLKKGGYKLKGSPSLIYWKDIKNIVIINQDISQGFVSVLVSFLIVQTKNNKKYQYPLHNTEEFIQALKKLNKYHLLSKDSRYK